MRNKICGIYKITSPSGGIYIGQSSDCLTRKRRYRNAECVKQSRLYFSIIKYGWDAHAFEIIYECPRESLNYWEKFYVDEFNSFNSERGLNLRDGGGSNGIPSEETKAKNSRSLKAAYLSGAKERPKGTKNGMFGNGFKLAGDKNGRYGMVVSEETKRKISDSNKKYWDKIRVNGGKTLTEEHKRKISESNKGIIKNVGSKRSDATKLKMSKASLGRRFSNETKKRMGKHKQKILLNTETGIFYIGVKEAALSIGVHIQTLYHKLSGYYKNNTSFIYA